jgi:hypothetical protein
MDKTPSQVVLAIREGGWTERMHCVPHHGEYSVAKHSWAVASLIALLCPNASNNLIMAALWHDVPERWVGDTPAPAKYWLNPELGRELKMTERMIEDELGIRIPLSEEERQWLAACDVLECLMWTHEQLQMGNQLVRPTMKSCIEQLQEMPLPEELKLFIAAHKFEVSETTGWWKAIMGRDHNVSK